MPKRTDPKRASHGLAKYRVPLYAIIEDLKVYLS